MDEMDSGKDRIVVSRVDNGWTIHVGGHWDNGGGYCQTFVARKAGELADLIHIWASRQAQTAEKTDK